MLQRLARTGALCTLISLACSLPAVAADDWQPVSAEDLQLKRVPQAPTAAAIYLYRQVDRDDANYRESVYERIKILTEEGRGRANVEIAYTKDRESIRGLQARTIRPDGSIIEFNGEVYEKPLVKRTGYSVMSKSFTLPGAEVGSIIEYRYNRSLPFRWVYDSKWLISGDLFTRRGVFSLHPNHSFLLRWSWPLGLPPDTRGPTSENGVIRLEAHDVPAFVTEEYMPPEDSMKYRVEFIYEGEDNNQRDEAKYWKATGKSLNARVERFVRGERALEKEVARLVQPGDSAEVKARKIYARAQQIRNLSFERRRTEEEMKREDRDENHDAGDVLEHGYAYADEITWLTYGLLRAAKLETAVVYVPPRDDYFFDPRLMNARMLTTCVLYVRLGDTGVFLDPGTPLMPFAILPWSETAVTGLRLTEQGGAWMNTTLPSANESRVERKAVLKLSPGGSLEGKVTVSYTGLEAAARRLVERNDDDTERRKMLEEELEAHVPVGIDVKLTNSPAWTDPETPLVAEFDFKVSDWATAAGSRSLLGLGLFGAREKHAFEHSARVHPVYFAFPYQHSDEIAIELPPGWQASTVPEARTSDIKAARYTSSAQASGGTLRIKRDLVLNTVLVQQKFYSSIYSFFQTVRAGDEDQVVIAKQ
jgi:hypothetical protein